MLITSKGRYALRLMIYIATCAALDDACRGEVGDGVSCRGGDARGTGSGEPRGLVPETSASQAATTAPGSLRPAAKIALREVAEREHISLKYLEQLVRPLMAAGLLTSVRGKGGGYALARPASEIRAGDVLRAAEGERAAIACDGLEGTCGRSDLCTTVQFWAGLEEAIDAYVDGVTLADLVHIPEFVDTFGADGL